MEFSESVAPVGFLAPDSHRRLDVIFIFAGFEPHCEALENFVSVLSQKNKEPADSAVA